MKVIDEDGRSYALDQPFVANGGEGAVYRIDNEMFKILHLPDYYEDEVGRQGARQRLQAYPAKLKAYPAALSPDDITLPTSLLYNARDLSFVGYKMPYVEGHELSLLLSGRYRRKHGITYPQVWQLMVQLHELLSRIHHPGVVVGDFKPRNVMVLPNGQLRLIDADGVQIGKHRSMGHTKEYADPLRLNPPTGYSRLASRLTDWYAFTVTMFQALFLVLPYGGVRTDGKPLDSITKELDYRIAHRQTVLEPTVEISDLQRAIPFMVAPTQLMDYFRRVFVHDARGEFPRELLNIAWQQCDKCNLWHARARCPACMSNKFVRHISAGERMAATNNRGYDTGGRILYAGVQQGQLRVLARRGDQLLLNGEPLAAVSPSELQQARQFMVLDTTAIAVLDKGLLLITKKEVTRDSASGYLMAANRSAAFMLSRHVGILKMLHGNAVISVHSDCQQMWVGDEYGLALSATNRSVRITMFRANRLMRVNSATLPLPAGNVQQVACYFGELVWLVLRVAGKLYVCVLTTNAKVKWCGEVPADSLFKPVEGFAARGSSLFVLQGKYLAELCLRGGQLAEVQRRKVLTFEAPSARLLVNSTQGFAIGRSAVVPFALP